MEQKKRLSGITFARAFCAIGIIIFHFFCHSNSTHNFLYYINDCSWGDILVTVFFAISGTVLYYNYEKNIPIASFYYKRWKTIYIPFYVCYLIFFIERIFVSKTIFWGGNPIRLVLSIIGLDGYMTYRLSTYYLVGEWFLGAVILIYLLFPFILNIVNKWPLIMPLILIAGYAIQYFTDFYVIPDFRNLITCLGSFYFGIICIKYRTIVFYKCWSVLLAFLLFAIILLIGFNTTIKAQILGMLFFVLLVACGEYLLKNRMLNGVVGFVSGISFYVFLLQHQIILHVLDVYNPSDFIVALLLLCAIIFLTLTGAKIVQFVTKRIYACKFMKSLENRFIANERKE